MCSQVRYKILIEYCGQNYYGWQKQDQLPTIQQEIESAIYAFSKQEVEVYGSGRTDAGVSAIGQVAHFDISGEFDTYKLTGSINHFLKGKNIGIKHVEKVSADFHARFSAKSRQYVYKILNRNAVPILDANSKTWIKRPLDIIKMQEAAKFLIGQHDFSSFRASICQAKSALKTLDSIEIVKIDAENIELYFSAQSFLHHMVRNMVGSLLLVGNGKWEPIDVKNALIAKSRAKAGPTAPAQGLYFLKVNY